MTKNEAIEILVTIKDDNIFGGSIQEALELAINALEKQIPKNTTTNIDDILIPKKCSVCGNITMPFDSKYCCDCGQRLE